MKMKKGLLMVVLLLALSSIMAAMSYTSAKVTSAMTGTVVSTDAALLALSPGNHAASKLNDNVLKIDFDKGQGGTSFGLQKHSEYVWNKLFSIQNNSENAVDVTIKNEKSLPSGVQMHVNIDGKTWHEITNNKSFKISELKVSNGNQGNGKGQGQGQGHGNGNGNQNKVDINVKVTVDNGASLGNFTPNLVVEGTAK